MTVFHWVVDLLIPVTMIVFGPVLRRLSSWMGIAGMLLAIPIVETELKRTFGR
jgi:hypothetical protein